MLADEVEVGSWRLRRWVIGRSNLYTAELGTGETVSATTLKALRGKLERLLPRAPAG